MGSNICVSLRDAPVSRRLALPYVREGLSNPAKTNLSDKFVSLNRFYIQLSTFYNPIIRNANRFARDYYVTVIVCVITTVVLTRRNYVNLIYETTRVLRTIGLFFFFLNFEDSSLLLPPRVNPRAIFSFFSLTFSFPLLSLQHSSFKEVGLANVGGMVSGRPRAATTSPRGIGKSSETHSCE